MRRTVTLLAVAILATACADGAGREDAAEVPSTTTVPTTTTTTSTAPAPTVPPTSTSTSTTVPPDVFGLRPPRAATTPEALAGQIAAAEATIRDPGAAAIDLARAALAQQVAYRQLGSHPEWDRDVLAALPAELHTTAQRHAAARREFRGMHTKPSNTLPAWRIVEPLPADQLVAIYQEAGRAFDIPWTVLAAINLVETGTGRIRGTSTAGAQGPMQFLPSTWAAYGAGGDINDTHDAIFGAARYLAANNGATDLDNALFRYNNSARYVRGVKLYADLIAEHPRAFLGVHLWGVWYLTTEGDVYLPVGYAQAAPVPVASYRP